MTGHLYPWAWALDQSQDRKALSGRPRLGKAGLLLPSRAGGVHMGWASWSGGPGPASDPSVGWPTFLPCWGTGGRDKAGESVLSTRSQGPSTGQARLPPVASDKTQDPWDRREAQAETGKD